jgi:hypothetical protein
VPDPAAEIHKGVAWPDTDALQKADAAIAFPLFHWIVHNRLHARGPNIAVPSLTMFAPSSIATL